MKPSENTTVDRSPARLDLALLALSFVLLVVRPAEAQERDTAAVHARGSQPSQPWAYVEDPSIAYVGVIARSQVTLSDASRGLTRPFAADVAREGAVFSIGAEAPLFQNVSLQAIGWNDGPTLDKATSSAVMLAARFAMLSGGSTRATLTGGALRNLGGESGGWARLSLAQDLGRARLATTVHAEHLAASGHDGVDIMVMAGASVRVAGVLRSGIEYVAQDLEGAFDTDAEGGVRHFLGPTLALDLAQGLSAIAGPALGLSRGSPRTVGRVALSFAF